MVCILISYLKNLCEVGKGTVLQSSNFELQSFPQLPQANWSLLQMPTNTLYVPTSQPSQARIQAPPQGAGASLPPCFFQQTLVSLRAGVVHHSFLYLGQFLAEQAAQTCGDPTALTQLRGKNVN